MQVMDKDLMMADDFLGMAVVPLRSLLFAEGINPFKGQWPQTNVASLSSGATSPTSSHQPMQHAEALFHAPVYLEGVPKGFLRGHVNLQPEPVISIESLWDARSIILQFNRRA